MRSPGYAIAISWVSEIWNNFDREIIKRSFHICGITQEKVIEFILYIRFSIKNYRSTIPRTTKCIYDNNQTTDIIEEDDGSNEINGYVNPEDDERKDTSENEDNEESSSDKSDSD